MPESDRPTNEPEQRDELLRDAIKLLRDFLKIANDGDQSLTDYAELAERVEKFLDKKTEGER